MIYFIIGVVVLFLAYTIYNSQKITGKQPEPSKPHYTIDEDEAVKRFADGLKFKTVSFENSVDIDYQQFIDFNAYLENEYALVYQELETTKINEFGLIFHWKSNSPKTKPIAFLAHYDVVPVLKGTETNWLYQPFSGTIAEGKIWGRGSLDFKVGIFGLLEAAQTLLKEGYKPQRDVYLLFGFDEEISGRKGAGAIVEHLHAQGVHFDFVLDEGGAVIDSVFPGISEEVGVIGLAEKGLVKVQLELSGSGGHASQPKRYTNIGRISRAIARLEKKQFASSYSGPIEKLFDYLSPNMPFLYRYIFANKKIFKPIMTAILLKSPTSAALIRSTIAPTIFQAGEKENVLPESAKATINIRVAPHDTIDGLKNTIEQIIDDKDIAVSIEGSPATRVSPTESHGFASIQQAARNVYPEALFAPYLMLAASDARHYDRISDGTYRFFPVKLDAEDLTKIHGTNEYISIDNYMRSIVFYAEVIKGGSKSN